MVWRTGIFLLLLTADYRPSAVGLPEETPHRARVSVPVADLRKEPVPPQRTLDHDPLEESQLLYGELVEVMGEREGWVRVATLEQLEWTHHGRWEGYPGWMQKSTLVPTPDGWEPNLRVITKLGKVRLAPREDASLKYDLSIGSMLNGVREGDWWKIHLLDGSTGWIRDKEVRRIEGQEQADTSIVRQKIVETARLFLGDPYYWGGRSAHHPQASAPPYTAVDCSGLVGLTYQANGLNIPRDAHEQWMKAKPIARGKLRPGDFVFLSDPNHPKRITHVMLYTGEGRVIEGPGTGQYVREMDLEKRLKEAGPRRAFFGTYAF